MFFLKKALLAKLETTYGTDPVPTGAANAMLGRNLTITPVDGNLVDRTLVQPYFGGFGALPISASVKLECEIEVAGSGAAGTAPAYGPLLRACGLSETINVGVSAVYAPVSTVFESCTIYFHMDGVLHKLTGCRGNVAADFNNEAIPVYKFSMTGLYNAPSDAALPTLTLTSWQKPLAVNKVNTTPFTLLGFAGVMSAFHFDLGNNVAYKGNVNTTEFVRITDRKVKGSASMEAVSVATKDWFGIARAGTTGALTMTHGTAAGNKVKIDAPVIQLGNPKYEDGGGVVMIAADLMFIPNAGNDEITITVL